MQSKQQDRNAGDHRQHQSGKPDADTNYTACRQQNAFDSILHIKHKDLSRMPRPAPALALAKGLDHANALYSASHWRSGSVSNRLDGDAIPGFAAIYSPLGLYYYSKTRAASEKVHTNEKAANTGGLRFLIDCYTTCRGEQKTR
jgi:hypothetical protein